MTSTMDQHLLGENSQLLTRGKNLSLLTFRKTIEHTTTTPDQHLGETSHSPTSGKT